MFSYKKRILDFMISVYKKYGHLFQGRIFYAVILIFKFSRVNGLRSAIYEIFKNFSKIRVYKSRISTKKLDNLMQNTIIDIDTKLSSRFVYSIDVYKTIGMHSKVLGNCAIDYGVLIRNGYNYFKYDTSNNSFKKSCNDTVNIIDAFVNRMKNAVAQSDHPNRKFIESTLSNFANNKATSLEDALQRILIINSMIWQNGHILVGLGRMDKHLEPFCNDQRSDEEIIEILKDFITCLHKYYYFKSNALVGDTGQIMIIGGLEFDGSYFYNRFSLLLSEALKQCAIPDPKILVRISQKMPECLWRSIFSFIEAQSGSPLLSNDDAVIPRLLDFGYSENDACNYTTSSCWEPVVYNSYEQNNIVSIDMLKPFEYVSAKRKTVTKFEDVVSLYEKGLRKEIIEILSYIDKIKWEPDPILSLVSESCRTKEIDASEGGCRYNNYGLLTVGTANAVNSLLNVNKFCFNENKYTFTELDDIRKNNFKAHEFERMMLKNAVKRFGISDEDVIELTNQIMSFISDVCKNYRNRYGGKVKIGFSSPHYIMNSCGVSASFDGRMRDEPFSVHISNDKESNLLSLFEFSSQLDYNDNRFNGNVTDFIISHDLLYNHTQKFEHAIQEGFRQGVYQMQMNLISSAQLIQAKSNPELFPNLIVRVWGFNAHFKDLPDEYQDYLIERAINYENAS